MANAVKFRISPASLADFQATLRRYSQFSRKDHATIVNTKALYICRGALRLTPKADKTKIASELGRIIKSRSNPGESRLKLVKGALHNAPLAAMIINKRRGRGRGLYGQEMAEAIRQMLASRFRSIGFLKSGWIPAIKILSPFADRGGPRLDRSAQQRGKPKGDAQPAKDGWKVKAIFENSAGANKNNRGALVTYGLPALEQAVRDETTSMLGYIERKLKESAKRAGIKVK